MTDGNELYEQAMREGREDEEAEELGPACDNCGYRGEHDPECLECSGTCSRRYWEGEYGCPDHRAYNYAEEMADRRGGRI